MINLTNNDFTQKIILGHLQTTENMLREIGSKLSNSEQEAQIIAMPDLGFPRNTIRILGGFFTGALYSWETKVPFIPVDTTVNSCGVSVFKLNKPIEDEETFFKLIKYGIKQSQNSSYDWNYDSGNHFINYGIVEHSEQIPTGYYVVLHSSASEFKDYHNGLYPKKDNWFYHKIHTYNYGNRYIRYISGKTAEEFYNTSSVVNNYNKIRQRYFANILFENNNEIEDEVLYAAHYGMPNINSVAIGCNYIEKESMYLLLTTPNQPCFFIKPYSGGQNQINLFKEFLLTPHGLGMQMIDEFDFNYAPNNNLLFNNKLYSKEDKLSFKTDLKIRDCFYNNSLHKTDIEKFLVNCPGQIIGEFKTKYSYNNNTNTY